MVFPVLPLRALDSTAEGDSTAVGGYVEEVLQTLNDLIEYFKQPDSELEHEEKQGLLRSLIKRQDLFKEEVRGYYEATKQDYEAAVIKKQFYILLHKGIYCEILLMSIYSHF